CIVLPQGYRLAVSVRGTDYVFPGEPGAGVETLGKVWTGVGPFTHNDPRDRPPAIFGADVTLHAGPDRPAHVLLTIIPAKCRLMSYPATTAIRATIRIDST